MAHWLLEETEVLSIRLFKNSASSYTWWTEIRGSIAGPDRAGWDRSPHPARERAPSESLWSLLRVEAEAAPWAMAMEALQARLILRKACRSQHASTISRGSHPFCAKYPWAVTGFSPRVASLFANLASLFICLFISPFLLTVLWFRALSCCLLGRT